MTGDRQGQRHRMAVGLDESTERNRDRWRCSCCACMQGGGNQAEKSAAKKKKRGQHPAAPQGDGTEKDKWLGPQGTRTAWEAAQE